MEIILPSILIVISIASFILAFIKYKSDKKQRALTASANTKYENLKSKYEELDELFSGNDEFLQNVGEVLPKIKEIFKELCKSDSIRVLNYGLDLETVIPWLNNSILSDDCFSKTLIQYKGLIINPDAVTIKPFIDGESDIQTITVKSRLKEISKLDSFNLEKVDVEIRSYDALPIFHGFIINEKYLFLSFTEIVSNKLKGGLFPYVYMELDNTSKLNSHYFNMYNSWFSHMWKLSNSVYKIKNE